MTRVNLVPAKMLMDQHLTGELHEISRVGTLATKANKRGFRLDGIPEYYRRGTGHVLFFYNKGGFIKKRIAEIVEVCKKRGVNVQVDWQALIEVWDKLPKRYNLDYYPSEDDMNVSVRWLQEKVAEKPKWYKYKGENLTEKTHKKWVKRTNKLCPEYQ